jgi:hypothetical protein
LKIGEILVAQGAITDVQLNQALQQQRGRRVKVGEALILAGALDGRRSSGPCQAGAAVRRPRQGKIARGRGRIPKTPWSGCASSRS